MKDLIIIPACGEDYLKYAETLRWSMRVWGWDSHADVRIYADAAEHRKSAKVGFRHAIGEHTGKVILMDADMVAVGDYPFARYNALTAVAINDSAVDSCLLLFPDVADAIAVSERWEELFDQQGRPNSDVPALNQAIAAYQPKTFNRSAQVYPAPSVYHYCGPKSAYYQAKHAL